MKKIGVIMLNTRFPRIMGDIGNPQTFKHNCEIFRLQKSVVSNIVCDQVQPELINEITEAALALQSRGSTLITTSCGFLSAVQEEIQQKLTVPFIASSLCLLPFLRTVYGSRSRLGIITFDSRQLKSQHLPAIDRDGLVIAGVENGQELHRVINHDETSLNKDLAKADVLAAADKLIQSSVSCLVLECTNLSPYKEALRRHTGLPVFDLVDTLNWIVDA